MVALWTSHSQRMEIMRKIRTDEAVFHLGISEMTLAMLLFMSAMLPFMRAMLPFMTMLPMLIFRKHNAPFTYRHIAFDPTQAIITPWTCS